MFISSPFAPRDDAFTKPVTMHAEPDVTIARWNLGELNITAVDGSSISINANTSDLDSIFVSINGGQEMLWPWMPDTTPECLGPFGGC